MFYSVCKGIKQILQIHKFTKWNEFITLKYGSLFIALNRGTLCELNKWYESELDWILQQICSSQHALSIFELNEYNV